MQKNVSILSCFFDQSCCYILYPTKNSAPDEKVLPSNKINHYYLKKNQKNSRRKWTNPGQQSK